MGKYISLEDVEQIYNKLYDSPGGSSWLEVDGCRFSIDTGYAFEGIDVYHKFLLQLFEKDFTPDCEVGITHEDV